MLKLVAFFSLNETTIFPTPLGTNFRISGNAGDLSKEDFLLIICKKTEKNRRNKGDGNERVL